MSSPLPLSRGLDAFTTTVTTLKTLTTKFSRRSTQPHQLPSELIDLIVPYVEERKTLASLALVSRHTNEVASSYLYKVVRLATPKAITNWLNCPFNARTKNTKYTKHLELHFDLRYYRDKTVYKAMWDRPVLRRFENLESVYLTTAGFHYYMDDVIDSEEDSESPCRPSKPSATSVRKGAGRCSYFVDYETMHEGVNRLLFSLVDPLGPKHFKWRFAPLSSQHSNPIRRALGKARFELHQSINKSRRDRCRPYPRIPRMITKWLGTESYDLPFFALPLWRIDTVGNIKVFTMAGNGVHKWIRAAYWTEHLIKELSRDGAVLEISGRLKRGREDKLDELREIMRRIDIAGKIQLVCVDEKEETPVEWRKRVCHK